MKAKEKKEISNLALTKVCLIIDSLEPAINTHEIANISIDRAEAADARASTPETSSETKQSIFGKGRK